MAEFTLLRESGRGVTWIRGPVEVLQVTTDASAGGEVVVPIDVALSAGHFDVRTGQRECGFRVIKGGRCPRRGGVARVALLRETSRGVVGIGGALVVLEMAGDASGRGQVEVAVRVALIAPQGGVGAGQRETHSIVIESGRLPSRRRMAFLASLWKSQCDVVRIRRLLVIGKVTTHTGCRRALILPAPVAGRAVQRGVHSR